MSSSERKSEGACLSFPPSITLFIPPISLESIDDDAAADAAAAEDDDDDDDDDVDDDACLVLKFHMLEK